jgi:hypothetical protein
MSRNAVVKLSALCLRQRRYIRFQAFPYRVQQVRFFRGRETLYLVSQIAHLPTTLAPVPCLGKPLPVFRPDFGDGQVHVLAKQLPGEATPWDWLAQVLAYLTPTRSSPVASR